PPVSPVPCSSRLSPPFTEPPPPFGRQPRRRFHQHAMDAFMDGLPPLPLPGECGLKCLLIERIRTQRLAYFAARSLKIRRELVELGLMGAIHFSQNTPIGLRQRIRHPVDHPFYFRLRSSRSVLPESADKHAAEEQVEGQREQQDPAQDFGGPWRVHRSTPSVMSLANTHSATSISPGRSAGGRTCAPMKFPRMAAAVSAATCGHQRPRNQSAITLCRVPGPETESTWVSIRRRTLSVTASGGRASNKLSKARALVSSSWACGDSRINDSAAARS